MSCLFEDEAVTEVYGAPNALLAPVAKIAFGACAGIAVNGAEASAMVEPLPRAGRSGIGASFPFALVLANVSSAKPTTGRSPLGKGSALTDVRPREPSEGKLDGSEDHEGGQSFREVLEILGKPPVAPEPEEGALDHPAARQDDEASVRLTISRRTRGTFAIAASTCQALYPPSAQISSSHRKRRRILSSTKPAPSRSWISAEWTTTRIGSPSLSTRA